MWLLVFISIALVVAIMLYEVNSCSSKSEMFWCFCAGVAVSYVTYEVLCTILQLYVQWLFLDFLDTLI